MITFELSEDQRLVQETVRKFAAEEIRPRLREFERARGLPDEVRRKFHELGVGLVDVPESLGGSGLGMTTAVLVHEELAFADAGAAVALWAPGFVPQVLLEVAPVDRARRMLAPFLEADGWKRLGAVAYSENAAGGEGFQARAHKDGEGWVIDGEKSFVTNGDRADLYVVFAQVDPQGGWKGIGGFAVEGTDPGIRKGPRAEWVGLETVSAASVSFDGCRAELLASDDIVMACRRFFARAALITAARQVGLARAAYEYALAYTQERHAFGKPVAHFQAISFTLAEMGMDVESARWMVWRAAAELDSGHKEALASVAKAAIHANEAAWRVADNGVQLLGGAGFVKDYPLEKWMRDTKALALMGPTDQLEELIVAAGTIGKGDFGVLLPAPAVQPVIT